MNIFQLRMLRAALRQCLRDRSDWLTENEIDKILDQISKLTKIIDELDRKDKR
jgi:flagellin-specific chaperone FliS